MCWKFSIALFLILGSFTLSVQALSLKYGISFNQSFSGTIELNSDEEVKISSNALPAPERLIVLDTQPAELLGFVGLIPHHQNTQYDNLQVAFNEQLKAILSITSQNGGTLETDWHLTDDQKIVEFDYRTPSTRGDVLYFTVEDYYGNENDPANNRLIFRLEVSSLLEDNVITENSATEAETTETTETTNNEADNYVASSTSSSTSSGTTQDKTNADLIVTTEATELILSEELAAVLLESQEQDLELVENSAVTTVNLEVADSGELVSAANTLEENLTSEAVLSAEPLEIIFGDTLVENTAELLDSGLIFAEDESTIFTEDESTILADLLAADLEQVLATTLQEHPLSVNLVLLTLASGGMFWFLLWRRRKKEDKLLIFFQNLNLKCKRRTLGRRPQKEFTPAKEAQILVAEFKTFALKQKRQLVQAEIQRQHRRIC